MKIAISLRTKVLVLALVNAALLAGALIWFTRTQLTQDLGNLLLGEARARLTEVAVRLGEELPLVDRKDQDRLLAQYSARHGVTFYLVENAGKQYAGPRFKIPEPIDGFLRENALKSPLAALEGLSRGPNASDPPLGRQELVNLLAVVREPPFFARSDEGYWVAFRIPLRSRDHPFFIPGVLVMASPSFFTNPFFFDSRPWLGICGVILLIALACWLPLVRSATRSIHVMATATAEIAKGKFGTKVDVPRSDELGKLGISLNRMATQLEGYIHGQKRFLRDAAHELRSPIARMQAALGNILEGRVDPEQQPFLEDLKEEIDLMSSLTGELLTFAREENQQGRLNLVPVKLSDAVERVIGTENPAAAADIRLRLEKELIVNAHPESLFRGLSNVVRNAIRYAGHAGPITIAAQRRRGAVVLTVSDQGPGIPEESLEMVFVPFYRLDISRDRQTGGNGLGMSIARSCIESCKGTIFCRNANPGLDVTITLQEFTQR